MLFTHGLCRITSALMLASGIATAQVSVTANYSTVSDTLRKSALLVANEGGYRPVRNPHWFADYFDDFAEAGLRRIAVPHIMDDQIWMIFSRNAQGQTVYNYAKLDSCILPLTARGIEPIMQIWSTPVILGGHHWDDMGSTFPTDFDAYANLVANVVQHYKGLGFSGWYWEFWNEPDNGPWGGTIAQFVSLYAKCARAVKSVDPTAKVGGPTETNAFAYLDQLLDAVKADPSIPLDFVSRHIYSDVGNTSWNVPNFNSKLQSRGLPKKEVYIGEWNYDATMSAEYPSKSDNNWLAAYLARMLFTANKYHELMGVAFFAPAEGWHPEMKISGDLGIMTPFHHRKAAFNTYKMYNAMDSVLVRTTVSGADGDSFTYAFTSKDPVSQRVALLAWNHVDNANSVTFRIDNLPYAASGRNIKVTRYLIDASHSNYFADWDAKQDTGFIRTQHEDLERVESSIIASSPTFTRTLSMAAHSVMQIVLEPTTLSPAAGPVDPAPTASLRNLAAGKSVSTSSSNENVTVGWGRKKLTDEMRHSLDAAHTGNPLMGWSSTSTYTDANHTEWATVDVRTPTAVSTVRLWPRNDYGFDGAAFPVDFRIQGSNDNSSWTDLVTMTNYSNGQYAKGPQTFSFPPATSRYFRVIATKLGSFTNSGTKYAFQLAEIELFAGPLPTKLGGVQKSVRGDVRLSILSIKNRTSMLLSNAESGLISARVFDLNGKLIESIPETWKSAGTHSLDLSSTRASVGGIFIVKVQVGQAALTRKLTTIGRH